MNSYSRVFLSVIIALSLVACQREQPEQQASTEPQPAPQPETNVVRVTAKEFAFHVEPELLSGWTTFQLVNEGHATHFFLLNLLPEGISFEQYRDEGSAVFDVVFEALKSGEANKA